MGIPDKDLREIRHMLKRAEEEGISFEASKTFLEDLLINKDVYKAIQHTRNHWDF